MKFSLNLGYLDDITLVGPAKTVTADIRLTLVLPRGSLTSHEYVDMRRPSGPPTKPVGNEKQPDEPRIPHQICTAVDHELTNQ